MITVKNMSKVIIVGATCLAAAGCATQTSAFRRMGAEEHERAAALDPTASADHLAAARDLRRLELAACVDVPEVDRERGPFARRERIAEVDIVHDKLYPKWPAQAVGVSVALRAAPGMTEQWVGRVLECHLAHRALVGATASQQACPLDAEDTRVAVSSTSTGFRVAITSRDPAVARSVIDSCLALVN